MTSFEEVRELLARAQHEAQYRTIASRAYYAVFNIIVPIMEQKGFIATTSGDIHKNLGKFVRDLPDKEFKTIGHSRLPHLRGLRNRADYARDMPFTLGMAREAANDAFELEEFFSKGVPLSR